MTWNLDVLISGIDKKSVPATKAVMPQDQGICVGGYINIKNPVLIPRGGKRIFIAFVGFFEARNRKMMTKLAITKAKSDASTCIGIGKSSNGINLLLSRKKASTI